MDKVADLNRQRVNKGVSPVIATILMVAITVVLAATLYMMVGNYTGGNSTIQAPKINGQAVANVDGTWVNFTVAGNPVRQLRFTEIRYIYIDDIVFTQQNLTTSNITGGQWGYTDANTDGFVTNGDIIHIHLENSLSGGGHTIKFVHKDGIMYSNTFSA